MLHDTPVSALPVTKVIGVSLAALSLYKLFRLVYVEITSPLRHLPGPNSPSWFYGNLQEIWNEVRA